MVCGQTDSVVVSIGGSILVPGNNDAEYIARLASMLKELQLLALALGDMPDRVPETAEETASRAEVGRIAVMGGTEPGHTTDAVAMMVASCMDADRVVNATSVDAVYTDDPRSNPDAVRIPEMTIERLGEIVYKEHGASKSSVFDPLGVKIAAEKNIDIMIVDGRNLDELRKAILGERFDGTFVNSH